MRFLTLFFLALFFFWACNGHEQSQAIIKQPDMVSLLADMHLIKAYLVSIRSQAVRDSTKKDSIQKIANNLYASVYQKYQINQAKFDTSLVYYSKDPELLDAIYTQVKDNLEAKYKQEMIIRAAKQEIFWQKNRRYHLSFDASSFYYSKLPSFLDYVHISAKDSIAENRMLKLKKFRPKHDLSQ